MKNRVRWPALLAIPLIGMALFVAAFIRMGTNDSRAIARFSSAYQQYDRLVAEFSARALAPDSTTSPTTGELESQVDGALAALNAAASARISSLTRNDGTIMQVTREIASYSVQEVQALKAVQGAPSDASGLAGQAQDLASKRQVDYALFRELAGITN